MEYRPGTRLVQTPVSAPFELRFDVRSEDIDLMGHVNNVVYLRWVQDVAIAHWRVMATAEEQASLLWVVTRHEIDYKRPALAGDVVIATTWVGASGRRRFERHTDLLRASDGRLLAKALTLWCPIDCDTRRAVDLDDAVRARFSVAKSQPGAKGRP